VISTMSKCWGFNGSHIGLPRPQRSVLSDLMSGPLEFRSLHQIDIPSYRRISLWYVPIHPPSTILCLSDNRLRGHLSVRQMPIRRLFGHSEGMSLRVLSASLVDRVSIAGLVHTESPDIYSGHRCCRLGGTYASLGSYSK